MSWTFSGDRTIYSQLVEQLKLRIVTGIYPPGSRMDTVRELANDAAVNPNTMQRAMSELERRGLVFSQRTSGRFVTDDPESIAALRAELAQEKIAQLERDKIPIPLGNAIGSRLFSGKGPDIRIGVLPMGAVSAEYFTEFYAAGINQTRYKIYMVLKSDMALVVGRSSQSVHIESQVLIADAIIVGTVPQSYANLDGARGFIDLTP